MRSRFTLFACASLCLVPAFAQQESRQAVITGRPGSPKCTIEVDVDWISDVEIKGTVARLHTLTGLPSYWRRFECNQPMPLNPVGFRFRGIDGRGRQTLIGDPRSGGAAVVRIEDPKAGREGYTFDLEWDGAAGPMGDGRGGPGFPQAGPPPLPPNGDRDWNRGGDRGRDQRFGPDVAIHYCGESAERQLRDTGYTNTRVTDAKIDGRPGRGDWIYGTIVGQRGPRPESFGFACSVDFQARRVGAVNLRPSNDGYYGPDAGDRRFSKERAIHACGDSVQERLSHDGYADFNINRMDVDDRPGNNDWIVGSLMARRGNYSDTFEFSCSVDFDGGRIRSINVNRR